MDNVPKRPWFQFRLSTWFVLVAILGWAMATRPYVEYQSVASGGVELPPREESWSLAVETWNHEFSVESGPKSVAWPALALAGFLARKASWAVVERRRRESGVGESRREPAVTPHRALSD
jgi:hypothetical protein